MDTRTLGALAIAGVAGAYLLTRPAPAGQSPGGYVAGDIPGASAPGSSPVPGPSIIIPGDSFTGFPQEDTSWLADFFAPPQIQEGNLSTPKKAAVQPVGYAPPADTLFGGGAGFGGGGAGGRGGSAGVGATAGTVLQTGAAGSFLSSLAGMAFAPFNLLNSVGGIFGGGAQTTAPDRTVTSVASGVAVEPLIGHVPTTLPGYNGGAVTKKAAVSQAPAEEVAPFLQSGTGAGSVPTGRTSSGGTVYTSSSGARSVVSQGQIVAGTSRALSASDIARLPAKQKAALGYI